MSQSEVILSCFLILLVGVIAIGIHRLMFKKSIVFKIIATMTIPLVATPILAAIVTFTGFKHFAWAAPVIVILITISLEVIAKMLQKSLKEIMKTIQSLSAGDVDIAFNEKLQKGGHELAWIMRQLVELTGSFKKVASFADHVGKGNLNTEYALLGENDTIGKAMLGMRSNLQKAEAEMEESRREDERRNWATQGLAKFAEILRNDNDNLENLSYNIISNLVKYLDANQGGIFLLNDAEYEENRMLELKACYAFDRKKFVQKQIHPGEGLAGTCYLEGEPIYMTDVPENYIVITSGLGKANPRAILICPLKVNDVIYGIIELASFSEIEPYQLEFVQKVSESIASTVGSVKMNIRTVQLLEQSKLQASEMANAEEELRQNMEEMQATQEDMRRREVELQETVEKMREAKAAIEEKDHEMSQFHEAIFESFNILEFSPEGVIVNINDNLLKMLGANERSDFIGKHSSDFIGKEAHDVAWAKLTQGKQFENAVQIKVNGKSIDLHQRYVPISNKKGELLRALLLVVEKK